MHGEVLNSVYTYFVSNQQISEVIPVYKFYVLLLLLFHKITCLICKRRAGNKNAFLYILHCTNKSLQFFTTNRV